MLSASSPARKQESTTAQKVTAWLVGLGVVLAAAAVVGLFVLCVYAYVALSLVGDAPEELKGELGAVGQFACLDYSTKVVDLAEDGLNREQVQAVVDGAMFGDAELTPKEKEEIGRIDDPKTCGTVDSILDAAGK